MGFWIGCIPVLVLVCLMPVEYRAGATEPHPHALAQLIWEASHGMPRHHHVRASMHPCVLEDLASTHTMDADAPAGGGDVASSPGATRAAFALIAMTLVPAIVWTGRPSGSPRRWHFDVCLPAGLVHTPEPPPPRTAR